MKKNFALSRKYQEDLIRKGDYDCIIEFGSGFDPETSIWNSTNTALADSNTIIGQFLRDKPGSYFS